MNSSLRNSTAEELDVNHAAPATRPSPTSLPDIAKESTRNDPRFEMWKAIHSSSIPFLSLKFNPEFMKLLQLAENRDIKTTDDEQARICEQVRMALSSLE
jgi:hypothetical protein